MRLILTNLLLVATALGACSDPHPENTLYGTWRLRFNRYSCGNVWSFHKGGILHISGSECGYSLSDNQLSVLCDSSSEKNVYRIIERNADILKIRNTTEVGSQPFFLLRVNRVGNYYTCEGDDYAVELDALPEE